jgi:hypothetical protein
LNVHKAIPETDQESTSGQRFSGIKMSCEDVTMCTASVMIKPDVLELLKAKYMQERPLTFPVQTFLISRFTAPPTTQVVSNSTPLNIVLSQAVNNVDTLFILPFRNNSQHTCCYNPVLSGLQLQAGEFGNYPTQAINTYSQFKDHNIRFVNMAADCLNLNGADLTSFSRLNTSVFVDRVRISDGTDSGYNEWMPGGARVPQDGWDYDKSNFFVGIPFSLDSDFQGGLSSPSNNINFKLIGTFGGPGVFNCPWVAAFLIDGVLAIRPDPASDAAKVIWSDRTIV